LRERTDISPGTPPPDARPALPRWHEIAIAAAGVAASLTLLPLPLGLFAGALAVLAVVIAVVDLDRFVIPDWANAAVLALGVALALMEAESDGRLATLADAALRSLVAGGTLYALRFAYERLTGVEGLGLGDVKLAAAGAPWLQWETLPLALQLGALAALLAIAVRAVLRRERPEGRLALPFGAFLAPALWAAFMAERLALAAG
jgi:leader peptidase (prepilin peptidase)/N-methyltransferase